ncbi:unnamed protein product [Scytosiphon promiscuus]
MSGPSRPSTTGSKARLTFPDRDGSTPGNSTDSNPPWVECSDRGGPSTNIISPVGGRDDVIRTKPKGAPCSANHRSGERWKRPNALRPLSRSFSGHVYSKKMTLGCTQPSSRGNMRARKIKSDQSRRRREAVRSMLPWWQNSLPDLPNTCAEDLSTAENTVQSPGHLREELCQRQGASWHGSLTTTARNGEQKQQQLPTKASDAISTPIGVDGDEGENTDQPTVDAAGGRTSRTSDVQGSFHPSRNHEDGLQHGTKPYNHYSNLFENPPPSIPTVDQYIFDDNIRYKAITKRGHTEAIPVETGGDGVLGIGQCGSVPWDAAFADTTQETDGDPSALLYADEDIDKLLSFFDNMGDVDKRVTLEEMISGFRKIRRKWAMVKAEQAGRVVLAKVVRLMDRAEMSLEDWFLFMDQSQNGRGDGKLTALELRSGLERLITYIARRECSCRAFKCDRMPNYGLPLRRDAAARADAAVADDDGAETTDVAQSEAQDRCVGGSREFHDAMGVSPGHANGSERGDGEAGDYGANFAIAATGAVVTRGGSDTLLPDEGSCRDGRFADCGGGGTAGSGRQREEEKGRKPSGPSSAVAGIQNEYSREQLNLRLDHRGRDQQAVREDGAARAVARGGGGGGGRKAEKQTIGPEEGGARSEGFTGDEVPAWTPERKGEGQEGENVKGTRRGSRKRTSTENFYAGRAVVCRGHALEGMVYLGQRRAYFQGLESQNFTSKEVSDLMRFIDTDVNFTLDIEEMRRAISRLRAKADDEEGARTSEAGHLLQVLEEHMHRTGARFTDVFFLLDRNRNGHIEKAELRKLFQQLSREPARRKDRARAKAELAEERKRQMELREAEAREAAEKLEVYKKAGAYPVLKRVEVWQTRTGKRLADGFQAGGGERGSGNRGLDVDELTAFMHNLNLDLSPAEAMLVRERVITRHRQDGTVEIKEVVAAVRDIRRYETVIKAAQKHGIVVNGSGGGRKQPAGEHTAGESAAYGGVRGAGYGGVSGAAFGGGVDACAPCVELCAGRNVRTHGRRQGKPLSDGPFVFRPPLEVITHGRARSAPARGRQLPRGATSTDRRPVTAASPGADAAFPRGSRGGGPVRRSGGGRSPPSLSRRTNAAGQGTARPARGIGSADAPVTPSGLGGVASREDGGDGAFDGDPGGVGGTMARAPARKAATAASVPAEPTPPWMTGLRDGLDDCGGWWPAARNAAEDGARLDIFTGSVLDGRWLHSLDSRLGATMRATRR